MMNKYAILILVNEYPCDDIVYIDNYPQLYPTQEKAHKEMEKLIKAEVEQLNKECGDNNDTAIYYKKEKNKIILFNENNTKLSCVKEYYVKEFVE